MANKFRNTSILTHFLSFWFKMRTLGGNYFISTEQVLSSLSMQRLKLYNKLDIQQSEDANITACCSQDLASSDADLQLIDNCYMESSNLNDDERSCLYYISGYVAHKEGLGTHTNELNSCSVESEFLQNISRSKLSHPPHELYDISLYYYSFFKSRIQKCCDGVFLEAYDIIHNVTDYNFSNIRSINKRFSNCFFKAFVKQETDKVAKSKNVKSLKKRKLDN